MAIRNLTYHEGCIWDPHFEGRGGRTGSSIVPLETALVVSYTLPIVTCTKGKCISSVIDNVTGGDAIANLFATKYDGLYSSVDYDAVSYTHLTLPTIYSV